MTIAIALDVALAALVVAVAAWTIFARRHFAAVVGFVVYGLLLAVIWVRLHAIDVALTEAAIGGLTGALLIGAAARVQSDKPSVHSERPGAVVRAEAAVLAALVAAASAVGMWFLPHPAPTLAHDAAAAAAATGLGNPVTNVLIAFRAMDTMLEKVVVLLALIGVWSLTPDEFWNGRAGEPQKTDPNGPLAFFARVLSPIGLVVAVYFVWVSADNPGGAFQAGTILAAMWLLVLMTGLSEAPSTGSRWLRLILIAGPAVFLLVGLGGLWLGDAFLAYPQAITKPLILIIEYAMTLTIAVTLCLLLLGPPMRKPS